MAPNLESPEVVVLITKRLRLSSRGVSPARRSLVHLRDRQRNREGRLRAGHHPRPAAIFRFRRSHTVSRQLDPFRTLEDESGGLRRKKPPVSPYIVTLILCGMALWFLYDGFFNPEIESIWFNRIGGVLLLIAAVWDGLRQRRLQQQRTD